MTNAGDTCWCGSCHHLVVKSGRSWVHVSDDDVKPRSDCECVFNMRPCTPEGEPRLTYKLRGFASPITRIHVHGSSPAVAFTRNLRSLRGATPNVVVYDEIEFSFRRGTMGPGRPETTPEITPPPGGWPRWR